MLDSSYTSDAGNVLTIQNGITDVISYQDRNGSATNQRPAKTRGYTTREIFFEVLHSRHHKYLNEKLKRGGKISVIGTLINGDIAFQ